ncbi:hypothetical protein FQR65_LT08385 [Abscondita terminalis]|nr:hypothetical protein FQR65_LT08385 [Abscondita terminalis]
MPIRRSTDPLPLQHVWDAVRSANYQKQMADYNRIIRYLQRTGNCTVTQAELYLKQTLEDGLITTANKVKGAKLSSQVESYKIPNYDVHIVLDDYKDWYCIDCHLAGDVKCCRMCHRVFHEECANKKQKISDIKSVNNFFCNKQMEESKTNRTNDDLEAEVIDITSENELLVNNNIIDNTDIHNEKVENKNCNGYDLTLCSVCNMCKMEPKISLAKEELNYLLSFVHGRIKSWLPLNITDTMSADPRPEWITESEISWRSQLLFYQVMNMGIIENKLKMNEYIHLVQFKADVLTIQHNVAIFHGIESQEYGATEYMLEDCRYDLVEILNCPDCYKHSNEKINNKWFCLPCRVPHKLVWAKQKGYPYWPAKVLKETEDGCDVRFFGGKYERSVLQNMYVKPITAKMSESQPKKSAAFNKAVNELMLHQKMLGSQLSEALTTEFKNKTSPKSLVKKENANKRNKLSVDSNDELFNKTAEALEASLTAQSASFQIKRKRSTSPFSKTTNSKTMRKVNHIGKNKLQFQSSKNGTAEVLEQFHVSSDTEEESSLVKEKIYRYVLQVFAKSFFCLRTDGCYEEVTSSTEQVKMTEEQDIKDGPAMPETERQYSESVEKTRRKLEQCRDKKQIIKISLECMQAEIDRINSVHDEYIKKLFEVHSTQISETKKKQWCYNCEQDAIYHCCWNTAYCSPTCQQQHWQAEHKKVCRRKR